MPDIESDIITTNEASKLTGIPAGTLRYYRHTDQGPPSFTMGPRRVVYRRSELLQWIAQQEQTTRRGDDINTEPVTA